MQTIVRCTRIWIHINLQFSFLLRAGIWLFHDIYARKSQTLFQAGISN